MDKALQIQEAHTDELLRKDSVCGTGVGVKWVDGKPTNEPAVIVFVEKKLDEDGVIRKFSAEEIIPTELDGVATDIIEVGRIVKQGFKDKVRPIKPGYSCGHGLITSGTIGGVFLDRDGEPVVLSNNHVLAAENRGQIGDVIYQPGPDDAHGTTFSGWHDPISDVPCLGTLKQYVTLNRDNNTQDSAIARVHPLLIKQNFIDPVYPTINKPLTGFADPTVGMAVQKCGRTTGYTIGKVLALNATFTIGYDFGDAKFTQCVVLTAMSDGGDSGSIISNMNMQAVALLFAGSPKVTIATPFNLVRDHYGLELWKVPTATESNGEWRKFTKDGDIQFTNNSIVISENANQYCFVEKSIGDFKAVSATINTGTDRGASWGPGIVVQWPEGYLKVNLRHAGTFGGSFNGTESLSVGRVQPNTDYVVRIRKTGKTYIGEVMENRKWYPVIEIPRSVFPSSPILLRIGKTGTNGSTLDHSESGPESGQTGQCTITNVKVV